MGFTDTTNGMRMDHDGLVELVEGINERLLAAIAAGYVPSYEPINLALTLNLNDAGYGGVYRQLQLILENIVPFFLDHDAVAAFPAATWPSNYTLSTWRAAAGIHSSGFMRVTSWTGAAAPSAAGYGIAQTGDILGYWIRQELIYGMQALQKSYINGATRNSSASNKERAAGSDWFSTKGAAEADYATKWAAATQNDHTGHDRVMSAWKSDDPAAEYAVSGEYRHCYFGFNLGTDGHVAGSCVFYVKPNIGLNDIYWDYDDFTEDQWNLLHSAIAFAADAAYVRSSDWSVEDHNPLAESGVDWNDGNKGSNADNTVVRGIITWTFQHT